MEIYRTNQDFRKRIIKMIHKPVQTETSALIQHPKRKRGCLIYVKRGLLVLAALIIVLSLLGFAYETAAEASDRRVYLPSGQVLEVDGYLMHITCTGRGSPTVILEAGGGYFSMVWARIQPKIAQSTRVCAYDRAGYGWSSPRPEPRNAQRIAAELHSLLARAGVEPPYVMVGHSVGGLYIRVYNAQYPGEVVGMVLVDATHHDNWTRQGESIGAMQTLAAIGSVLSRVGLVRLVFGGQTLGLPAPQDAAVIAELSSAQHWDTQRADVAAMTDSIAQAQATGRLGNMPLAVVVAGEYPEGKARAIKFTLQRELAALSTNAVYEEIAGANHILLVTDEQYAGVTSEAITRVLEAARTGKLLAQ
jgi:pimeloyl-ACP methyl ester carboxylesterase